MALVQETAPLIERTLADEAALATLQTVAKMQTNLQRASSLHLLVSRVRSRHKDVGPIAIEAAVNSLVNCNLLSGSIDVSGTRPDDFKLTRAGWDALGIKPPMWMEV